MTKSTGLHDKITIAENRESFSAKVVGFKSKSCEVLQKKSQAFGNLLTEQKTTEYHGQLTQVFTEAVNCGFTR